MAAKPPSSGASEGPEEGASIPDPEWERFQRDLEVGARAAAAPKEPSARARMVAERLRQTDEAAVARQQRKRRWGRKREPEPWQPEGWRTGPAWQEMNGKQHRLGKWLAGLMALAAVGWGATMLLDQRYGLNLAGGADEPLPAETVAPTTAPPGELAPDTPTLEEPFAGSPARRWADGADAIELPKARRTGNVSAAEVKAGLKTFKEFLVATNLDPDVLNGGRPKAALALIDPQQPELASMREALKNPSERNDPIAWVSRFAPEEVRLVGEAVKVRGRMKVKEAEGGNAAIRADYTFTYPVEKVANPGEVTRTIVRRIVEVQVSPAGQQSAAGKIWLIEYRGNFGNHACDDGDGFLHPEFPSDLLGSDRPTGPTRDPYDRSRPLEELEELEEGEREGEDSEKCGAVSRV
ncbi:hypothetical protein [Streptomyces gobiensis]|uniref:hypothetical protein n=1 Tax=Streptomyces gobiensis TaxID=2875706 RepID=UPI001E56A881|nr:hypothetical protein [Streptomyces gobiensis]UGY93322.1 hypothetical protein test1122_17445 [Streptomyces gobiensis]